MSEGARTDASSQLCRDGLPYARSERFGMTNFEPFSPLHGLIILLFMAATALLVLVGRRLSDHGRRRLEKNLGLAIVALWIVSSGWWMLPARFDASRTLPLHVCDLTSLLAGLVL